MSSFEDNKKNTHLEMRRENFSGMYVDVKNEFQWAKNVSQMEYDMYLLVQYFSGYRTENGCITC